MGGDLEGTVPQSTLGLRPCTRPPIFREVVLSDARESTNRVKIGVIKELFSETGAFPVKKGAYQFVALSFCRSFEFCRSFVMSLFRYVAFEFCRYFVMSLFHYVAPFNGSSCRIRATMVDPALCACMPVFLLGLCYIVHESSMVF